MAAPKVVRSLPQGGTVMPLAFLGGQAQKLFLEGSSSGVIDW